MAPVAVVIVDSPNHRVMHWICGASHGMILAGGNGPGSRLHQLKIPRGVAVDIDGAVMVADSQNHRVVRWTHGSDVGELVAGGNRGGNGLDQLQFPRCVVIARDGAVIVADTINHRIVRWVRGATIGTVIAGGHGSGNGLHQLDRPHGIAIDSHDAVIIADSGNERVVRWPLGSKVGIVIAGAHGGGNGLHQLNTPGGIMVHPQNGSIIVADTHNHRIVRWAHAAACGELVAGSCRAGPLPGGRNAGQELDQLYLPSDIALERDGTVLVFDERNSRVMRWSSGSLVGVVLADDHGILPTSVLRLQWMDDRESGGGGMVLVEWLPWSVRRHKHFPWQSRMLVKLLLFCRAHSPVLRSVDGDTFLQLLLPLVIPSHLTPYSL